ncbi:MAG: quinone-dependent dihydroorotate dehydrogenase [Bacteroidales bacterium]|nr:quinone-dependent dihydroorotate dehydrogenase [Bacteroidales bacterium]
MSFYSSVVSKVLFLFDPEKIHTFTIKWLSFLQKVPGVQAYMRWHFGIKPDSSLEREVFGIKFPHPVGLAAGLDKNAAAFEMLGAMGFAFVEVGTVTPRPQSGNPKPRLFRLKEDKAIINRMGFNNYGVEAMVKKLQKRHTKVIVGGNIGKNEVTPNENAVQDYVDCFNALYPYVDYFVINVSCPNQVNLRELQEKGPLMAIVQALVDAEIKLTGKKAKPILLKISPDLTNSQLDDIIDIVNETGIAGVVATNTTTTRDNLPSYSKEYIESIGKGGLSGAPETKRSTEVIRYVHEKSNGAFPIIGVGGIITPEDAYEKLQAGASLVQIYSGFIFEGPSLIKKICKYIVEKNK